jgi:hypothetical protein
LTLNYTPSYPLTSQEAEDENRKGSKGADLDLGEGGDDDDDSEDDESYEGESRCGVVWCGVVWCSDEMVR